ncbi:MAG: hypothetical protein HC779_07140, partial [Phyllobacteriaceae bacterium]|nr:hypothetical protein [Phyllobacteriaceae bacterium]
MHISPMLSGPVRRNRMTVLLFAGAVAFAAGIMAGSAFANERYQVRTQVGVSPDLSAPWVVQLQRNPLSASSAQ